MLPKSPSSDNVSDTEYNLLHYLSLEKPKLLATPQSESRTNSRNQKWKKPSRISKWEDFNCSSLEKCCAGVFGELLKCNIEPMKFPHLGKDVITFANEEALEKAYVCQWTYPIVNHALSHAQSQAKELGICPPFVELVPGGNARRTFRNKPDWAGIRTTAPDDIIRTLNILPGDTKLSYKWKSTQIVPKRIDKWDMTQTWFWPLRQIFTYCMNSNTRYGYIISDEEVVAFRVRVPHDRLKNKPGRKVVRSKDGGTMEYAPIYSATQEAGKENNLTMNMAIWWLHLLAANNSDLQANYGPLIDETLDGLGQAPGAPPDDGEQIDENLDGTGRASPTTTVAANDSVTDSFATQPSAYYHSFGPLTGLTGSFASIRSTRSTASKRKRDSAEPTTEPSKRKKGKAQSSNTAKG
ncbi:hypothetical protein K491DRAFT_782472 [Lophiostoma macrostomum CBS 122681]|uniref:Uncharacterized protein n=1 Tax=Lophiostoma macrostomum CBS 122681 TaxID=1314788 RepID=A0A6A6SSE5_9PLEO|nr:hypothetical protein K491DRAFT_782472 [Lophiostoma macrostomum CBS 122681]